MVFAGGMGDWGDAGFGGERLGGREASAVIAEFGEDLGGVDLAAAGQALPDGAVGMRLDGRRDGGGEWLELGDEGGADGDQRVDEFRKQPPARLRGRGKCETVR